MLMIVAVTAQNATVKIQPLARVVVVVQAAASVTNEQYKSLKISKIISVLKLALGHFNFIYLYTTLLFLMVFVPYFAGALHEW